MAPLSMIVLLSFCCRLGNHKSAIHQGFGRWVEVNQTRESSMSSCSFSDNNDMIIYRIIDNNNFLHYTAKLYSKVQRTKARGMSVMQCDALCKAAHKNISLASRKQFHRASNNISKLDCKRKLLCCFTFPLKEFIHFEKISFLRAINGATHILRARP